MTPAPSLFLSYRRADAMAVQRLCARLKARFGGVRLFLDVEDIAPGQPFAEALTSTLAVVSCVLAVLGPEWLTTLERRRNNNNNNPDYVVLELVAALERPILVIPVLVGGASIPAPHQLPGQLVALSGRQAFALRDAAYEADVLQLSDAIADHLSPPADH